MVLQGFEVAPSDTHVCFYGFCPLSTGLNFTLNCLGQPYGHLGQSFSRKFSNLLLKDRWCCELINYSETVRELRWPLHLSFVPLTHVP